MRHRNSVRQLGRTHSHRKAMYSNMAASFYLNERVVTTREKAKELKRISEKLITRARRNLDLPENNHFSKDFNVSFSSMIIVAQKGKTTVKWENSDKVWDYAHNEPALTDYVEKQIRTYLDMLKKS